MPVLTITYLRNFEKDIEETVEGPTTSTDALAFARGLKKFAIENMPQLLPKL